MAHDHLSFDLLHRFQGNAHKDQKGCTAKADTQGSHGKYNVGDTRDNCKEDRSDNRQPVECPGDMVLRRLSGSNPRDKPAALLYVFCNLRRIECNGGVEVGEEDDQQHIKYIVEPAARFKVRIHPVGVAASRKERRNRNRQHQDTHREDDGDHAGLVDFEWDIGGVTSVHLSSHDTFGVLDGNLATPLLDHNDPDNNQYSDDQKGEQAQDIDLSCQDAQKHSVGTHWKLSNDTCKDEQRNAVSDAIFVDLFPEIHQEGCSGCQLEHGDGDADEVEFIECRAKPCDAESKSLRKSKYDSKVTGILGNLSASGFPFLRECFQ